MWLWIFDHIPQLTVADTELKEVVTVDETRFYNLSLNSMNNAYQTAQEGGQKWERFLSPWAAVLGEGGWLQEHKDEISAVVAILTAHTPRVDRVETLVGSRVVRIPRVVTAPLSRAALDRHECMYFLTVNVLEWRALDLRNREKNLQGLAFHIFIAHKLYEKTMKHMLATDVGQSLREKFMTFLDMHWNRSAQPPSKVDAPVTEPAAAGPSDVGVVPEKAPPLPLISSAPRRRWDQVIIDRLLDNGPRAVRTAAERLALRELVARRNRWEQYTASLRTII